MNINTNLKILNITTIDHPLTLYKISDDQDCITLSNITLYLYFMSYDIRAENIIERTIKCIAPQLEFKTGRITMCVSGLANIINLYEIKFNIANLLERTTEFIKNNPNYKISTHLKLSNKMTVIRYSY